MIADKVRDLGTALMAGATDTEKFDKGNQSAGRRTRKLLQDVRNKCKELRKEITDVMNTRGEEK